MQKLEPTYNPKEYEQKWYEFWEKNDIFHAPVDASRKPFTILMPPPNVTSQLHMGHGTGYTVQDVLIRWKRASGFNACWLPGTDHAGIATQMMVEKDLKETEGKTKNDIGRVDFELRLKAWKEKYGNLISEQFRRMGFSCDWKREAYTMDPKLSYAVREIFVKLFNDGLIYRSERLVNWDVALKTAVSDDEVENVETAGFLWSFKYPIENSEEFITIATTRPETMFGDTAVAIHPDDERYRHLHQAKIRLPLSNRIIPIIVDEYVKMEFGTGVVKITPAHDPNDFILGQKHFLPFINVMNADGTMNDLCPERFRGKDRFVCRKETIKAMKELNLFDAEKPYKHIVPHSERSKTVIEPRLSLQWFVRMKSLAEPAIKAAKDNTLKFYPEAWKKTYFHWLENIQDWCISRQLWWGHRIPIWYCQDCSNVITGMTDPTVCDKCGCKKLIQDEDVLDTWFSSWLWPVSPFGWPDETQDLKYFYPTDVLVTASDIIFLWVARMVILGIYTRKEVPFKDVYIAATVCDKQGRKFSKTLGNGIDPLELIEKYGTDAVRFTGIHLAPLGGRVRMEKDDFEAGAKFVNKIWNAARYLQGYLQDGVVLESLEIVKSSISLSDKWLLSEFQNTVAEVEGQLQSYRVNEAVEKIYHFVWHSFCDWGLECSKEVLNSSDQKNKSNACSVLVYVFEGCLRLLSPVMPFITEEIWHHLPRHPDWGKALCLSGATFPKFENKYVDDASALDWLKVQNVVRGIRQIRASLDLPPKEPLSCMLRCDQKVATLFEENKNLITRLGCLKTFQTVQSDKNLGKCIIHVDKGFEVFIAAEGIIDIEKEKKRLQSEVLRIEKILKGIESKLNNVDFMAKAPDDIKEANLIQKENLTSQLQVLQKNITGLN